MKVNEAGRKFIVDAGEDVSAVTYAELVFDPPVKKEQFKRNTHKGLVLETADLEIDGEPVYDDDGETQIYLANTYYSYTTTKCDLYLYGTWRVRLYVEFDDGTEGYFGPWQEFIVEE